jgi:predicted RNA binding protein YcfA (HicA-like mRNA interferase family)
MCGLYRCQYRNLLIFNIPTPIACLHIVLYLDIPKTDKKLEKMWGNPGDWKIVDLEVVASRFGVSIRKGKGSHMSFTHPDWVDILTVPAHRPIKLIYIKLSQTLESLKAKVVNGFSEFLNLFICD